jgi:hypothetical protein
VQATLYKQLLSNREEKEAKQAECHYVVGRWPLKPQGHSDGRLRGSKLELAPCSRTASRSPGGIEKGRDRAPRNQLLAQATDQWRISWESCSVWKQSRPT